MEKFLEQSFIDAYYEMCLAAAALRMSKVQSCLTDLNIPSSPNPTSQTLKIRASAVVDRINNENKLGRANSLRRIYTQVTCVFAIAMWDVLQSTKRYNDISTEPEIQFLRHVRNACAHGATFDIHAEMPHPACWRGKKIDRGLHGKAVFSDFMYDVDVYFLLLDINAKYYT